LSSAIFKNKKDITGSRFQTAKCLKYYLIAKPDKFLFTINGHEFHLSESRDVIGHVTIRFLIGHFLLVVLWNQASLSLTVSEIFKGKCDAMVDMTLNNLNAKAKVIHFGTNRFLIWSSYRLSIVTFALGRTV